MRNDESGLFTALEAALKAASEPLDCHALYEIAAVKASAASVNRVSDYLGNLWRRGLVVRLPAPKDGTSRSRWTYEWKGNKGPRLHAAMDYAPKVLIDRPSMLITDDGATVHLEFPNLIISIRQK